MKATTRRQIEEAARLMWNIANPNATVRRFSDIATRDQALLWDQALVSYVTYNSEHRDLLRYRVL